MCVCVCVLTPQLSKYKEEDMEGAQKSKFTLVIKQNIDTYVQITGKQKIHKRCFVGITHLEQRKKNYVHTHRT